MFIDNNYGVNPQPPKVTNKAKKFYKWFIYFASVVTLALLLISAVSFQKFYVNDYDVLATTFADEYKPTLTYYDTNRDKNPIREMVYVPSTATCGTSGSSLPYMNELLTIYKWPGVKGGCVSSQGSIKAGACSGTQNMVNERGAVDLNFW